MDRTTDTFAPFVPLTEARATLGESPVWSPVHGAYWWVDITGRRLFRTLPDGVTTDWATPEIPGFVHCTGTQVWVGMESGVFAFDPLTARFDRVAALDTPGMRFNDACRDGRGRIWAGTMDLDNLRDTGVLYLFDPAIGALTPKLDGFRTINGLAWDGDRQRLYLSDSHPTAQTVWTCALSPDDSLGPRTTFARFDMLEGRPDGAALDDAGHYWIAGVGGETLYRFTPDGDLSQRHAVPVASPTKPAFGPGGEMVLTSFQDDRLGGRLLVSRGTPRTSDQKKGPQ